MWICQNCGIIIGSSMDTLCSACIVARMRAYVAANTPIISTGVPASTIGWYGTYGTSHVSPDPYSNLFRDNYNPDPYNYITSRPEEIKPNDSRTAMLSQKIVTPIQAFNEMHLLLSSLVKQYGKKVGDRYVIELNGDTIEDAGFVAEKH